MSDAERYGYELLALCEVADRISDGVLPVAAVREIVGRMVGDVIPLNVTAYRVSPREQLVSADQHDIQRRLK